MKFGPKEVTSKDFYGQRQITDIFTMDVTSWWYLIRYHAIMEKIVVIL